MRPVRTAQLPGTALCDGSSAASVLRVVACLCWVLSRTVSSIDDGYAGCRGSRARRARLEVAHDDAVAVGLDGPDSIYPTSQQVAEYVWGREDLAASI